MFSFCSYEASYYLISVNEIKDNDSSNLKVVL